MGGNDDLVQSHGMKCSHADEKNDVHYPKSCKQWGFTKGLSTEGMLIFND